MGWADVIFAVLVAITLAQAPPGGLPPFASANPGEFSHSPLTFQPYAMPRGTWAYGLDVGYANAVELYTYKGTYYDFDGEVLRADFSLVRRLGEATFAQLKLGVIGAYAGFLDGAIDAYHSAVGVYYVARAHRPRNQFEYVLAFGRSWSRTFEPIAARPQDPELGIGHVFGPHWQLYGSLTLPGGAPDGYGRETVTLAARVTGRFALTTWLTSESSAGLALSPKSGPLAYWEAPVLGIATTGLRASFGNHAGYLNLIVHSAPDPMHDSPISPLAKRDVSLDFGYLHTSQSGTAFWTGMTEDLVPTGPAVDLVLRFGVSWDR